MTKPSEEDKKALEATKAPLMEHLLELRKRIVYALIAFGLSFGVCRPVGRLEPAANARAARQLEDRAEALFAQNEHRASLLHAAARWIEESGRDLAPIVAEGNFRRIFPFEDEIAGDAEAAFRSER